MHAFLRNNKDNVILKEIICQCFDWGCIRFPLFSPNSCLSAVYYFSGIHCCHFYCQDLITIPTPALEKDKESVIKSFLFFPKSYFKPCCTLYNIRKSLQSIIKVHVCNKFQENMSINVITVIHKIGTRTNLLINIFIMMLRCYILKR